MSDNYPPGVSDADFEEAQYECRECGEDNIHNECQSGYCEDHCEACWEPDYEHMAEREMSAEQEKLEVMGIDWP